MAMFYAYDAEQSLSLVSPCVVETIPFTLSC